MIAKSNPASFTSQSHLASDPATPTTVDAPQAFASWPAVAPTGPAADVTSTASPALNRATSLVPNQAVSPGTPSTPIQADSGTPGTSITLPIKPFPDCSECVFQPPAQNTFVPTGQSGLFDASITPTLKPSIGLPRGRAAAYESPPERRERVPGSTEHQTCRTRNCPSFGSGSGSVSSLKSEGFGSPTQYCVSTICCISPMGQFLRYRLAGDLQRLGIKFVFGGQRSRSQQIRRITRQDGHA